jgi:cytochrome c-type biogenesis protein CcmH
MRRLLPVASILLAFICGFAFNGGAGEQPTVASVTQGLTCQCGCGLTVANCNHPTCSFSVPMRTEVETMIGKGKSSAEIIGFYRAKYGEKVLSSPTTEGFNVLAWLMPFAAVALGGALIVFMANRWRTQPVNPLSGEAKPPPPQFDPELIHRLEREVRERS